MNTSHKPGLTSYYIVKRALDCIASLILLVPASILVSICYFGIKLETQGPAFFVQERPGYKGKLFKIYKLRTMIVETHRDGKPLADMERITKAGAIIRKFSIDELPQLLNVLLGQMSFIGPRPLLKEYLPLYTPEQMRRHDVLPGITGWAQVNGRNTLPWEEKFKQDVWYVDNISLLVDMKIFFLTLHRLISRRGINASETLTSPYFTIKEEV